MKIWMSGELQADIGDACATVQNEMELVINRRIKNNDYGVAVARWSLIPIILDFEDPVYHEVKKYSHGRKVAQFRLKIDHGEFLRADMAGKRRLMFAMILRSIALFPVLKVKGFDVDRFRRDMEAIGRKHGWMAEDSV